MSRTNASVPAGTARSNPLRAAVVAATLALAAAAPALAAPVVANSSYQIYVAGEVSGNTRRFNTLFDGLGDAQTLGGQALTAIEAVTDLGGGRWRITVDLDAAGTQLFPITGEGAVVGIGVNGDGLDLDGFWFLEDARHSYSAPTGSTFTTGNLADDYRTQYFSGPWGGLYPAVNGAFVNGNAGGRGYDHVQFAFTISQFVPEPGAASLVACALGLLALSSRRRTAAAPAA